MKHFILLICLLLCSTIVNAGWFSKGPDPLDQAQQKITILESRLSTQSSTLGHWQFTAAALGVGCLILLIIGTSLGSKTRHHYDSTRRLGRTPTTSPNLNGLKPSIVGQTAEENTHSTLAA